MPPSKHSGSSRSAHKDSDQIPSNQNYTLGDYSFRIERSSVPGSTNDKIEAICTDKDGHNARKSIQVPSSTQLDGWYVEANETEATVYAVFSSSGPSVAYTQLNGTKVDMYGATHDYDLYTSDGYVVAIPYIPRDVAVIYSESSQISYLSHNPQTGSMTPGVQNLFPITLDDGRIVYYSGQAGYSIRYTPIPPTAGTSDLNLIANMLFSQGINGEKLIGRFAIDIKDAGGDGPESDWTDPGDYDPDWEPEDPTHTLYVEVTGALSGRHNDPIEDPSYSYIPSDKNTVKDYGCGGDGGHGGGGGAGASTVIIHKFATNQANSKEVTALARRHGYGSGGGKGGKGGDGCILIYY